ncbi:uncharacterized protein LOC108664629 isoform X2 [Hyalella azteca]|uniref:Uncharacterized protein LOC108664629 isoform X2 n=1 Tax=Hyalella azteca TaxID=294128 RepID=A0A8B7MYT3_HYAAZ|nr:uncharacterized protein LOC108664629 isoform X2 [Hyalella azteca]
MEPSAISRYTEEAMVVDRKVLEGLNSRGPLVCSYNDKNSLISYFSSSCLPTAMKKSMMLQSSGIDLTAAKVDFLNYKMEPRGTNTVFYLSDLITPGAVGGSYHSHVIECTNRLFCTLAYLVPGYAANKPALTKLKAAMKFQKVCSFVVNLSVVNISKFLKVIKDTKMIFRSDDEHVDPADKKLLVTASWVTFTQILSFLMQEIERSCPFVDAAAVVLNQHERAIIMRLVYQHFSLVYRLCEASEGLEQRLNEARMLLMEDLETVVRSRMSFECVNLGTPYLVVFILVMTYNAIFFSFNVADEEERRP